MKTFLVTVGADTVRIEAETIALVDGVLSLRIGEDLVAAYRAWDTVAEEGVPELVTPPNPEEEPEAVKALKRKLEEHGRANAP